MNADVIAAIVAGVLAVVGLIGIIVPVLPGSILIGLALLVFAMWGGGWAWLGFALGLPIVVAGMIASIVLTGRRLKLRAVPNVNVTLALVGGVVGIFVSPLFGFLIGFCLVLYLLEWRRLRSAKAAVSATWDALKAVGLGMLVEFACGTTATFILAATITIHFVTK